MLYFIYAARQPPSPVGGVTFRLKGPKAHALSHESRCRSGNFCDSHQCKCTGERLFQELLGSRWQL